MSDGLETSPQRRLRRHQRTRQLLDTAWKLIGNEGTDALTLGRLANAAGVTKPVVYAHFGSRSGLLVALYQDFDQRQSAVFDRAIAKAGSTLADKADVIASCYIACVLAQGREIPGVLAALGGSAELETIRRRYQQAFLDKCRQILAPFAATNGVATVALWALLGAADGLSQAAVNGDISPTQARQELTRLVQALVERGK